MTIGANRKKLIQLAVAWTVCIGVIYYNFFTGPATPDYGAAPASRPAAATPRPAQTANPQALVATEKKEKAFRRGERFRPTMGRSKTDALPDPMTTDPTLRTDLLALVRGVSFEKVERDIFNFGVRKAPPPPPPSAAETLAAQQALDARIKRQQEASKKAQAPRPPSTPQAPKLSWKYYGVASKPGAASRRAFLLDGEEIMIGAVGEVFKKRYKIKRIGLTSIVIEDLQFEQEQTLSLTRPS